PAAPLHVGAPRLDPSSRADARPAAHGHPRSAAVAARTAAGLPLRATLCLPLPAVRRTACARSQGRGRAPRRMPSRPGCAAGAASGPEDRVTAVATDTLLEARDLFKHFTVRGTAFRSGGETVHAVDGVSLEVRSGETLGVVGESGCG